MDISRRIARILGPVLIALPVTEGPKLRAFAGNPAPVVYLNGTLLFAVGVAIVQALGRPRDAWSGLIAIAGAAMALAGLYRMGWPTGPQVGEGVATYAVLTVLAVAGVVLSCHGYRPRSGQ
jgi:hypothetical protein